MYPELEELKTRTQVFPSLRLCLILAVEFLCTLSEIFLER